MPAHGSHHGSRPSDRSQRRQPAVVTPPADPAPLGLAALALTTFLISVWNAGWADAGSGAWFGYGSLVQLCAGMREFRNRSGFGATAFSSYGGFWIGLAIYVELVAPKLKAVVIPNDLGWILLAFTIRSPRGGWQLQPSGELGPGPQARPSR